MTILGIDPGSYNFGYGILQLNKRQIVAAGCDSVKISRKLILAERLTEIYREMNRIIKEYKPDIAAIETIFYGKNIKSAFTLGHARGTMMLALANQNIEIREFSPREVKKAVVGNGNAAKEQVKYMVKHILNIDITQKTQDATDALAVALCEYNKEKYRL